MSTLMIGCNHIYLFYFLAAMRERLSSHQSTMLPKMTPLLVMSSGVYDGVFLLCRHYSSVSFLLDT
jgi:hypothetical protein